MTAFYLVVLCLACVGFGALCGAEIALARRLRSEDLIDRISDYTLYD